MESWTEGLQFERASVLRRLTKTLLVDPLANYLPASMVRGLLRLAKSELAAANWADPGGWRSMVITYDGHPHKLVDRMLAGAGAVPMALRNRRKLGAAVLRRLIEQAPHEPVQVLCLGAGPGQIIADALMQSCRDVRATLVDRSSDAFDYGRELASSCGIDSKVRFVQADVRDVKKLLDSPPDIVKMLGICEYLDDSTLSDIASTLAGVMASGSAIVFNSLSKAHGNDRFFRRVFGLCMVHRSTEQLQKLMAAAGFGGFVAIGEPMRVYDVVIARRN